MRFDRVIAVRNNKTIYRDGDKCIKVFRCGYSAADVMQEAFQQAYVHELGIPVPQLFSVLQYRNEWAIEMQYIRGKTMQQALTETDAETASYITMLAELHMKLHRMTAPRLPYQWDMIAQRLSNVDKEVISGDAPAEDSCSQNRCLCHGDFQPSNILIGNDSVLYVTDWSQASQGDPCFDTAVTYLLLAMEMGDRAAEHYLREYVRMTGASEEKIRACFVPSAAARMAVCSAEERRFFEQYRKYDG